MRYILIPVDFKEPIIHVDVPKEIIVKQISKPVT